MWNFSYTFKDDTVTSIALGGFDGLHVAHQKLISHLDASGALFVVDRGSATITPGACRQNYTDKKIINAPFELIKNYTSKEFVSLLKKAFPNLKKIVVGYDFHFGKGRECSSECLQEYFDQEVVVVDEVFVDGISVHSSTIRALIKEGNITQANRLLGRCYAISGVAINGQGIGTKEFVPTINLDVKEFLLPKEGVYATYSNGYKSISFLGHRVTTDGSFAVETHILEPFEMSDSWQIEFETLMRDNQKFESFEALKEQIRRDIDAR